MDNQGANLLRLLAGMMKNGGASGQNRQGPSQNLPSLQSLSALASSFSPEQIQKMSSSFRLDGDPPRNGRESACDEETVEREYFAKDETGCSWRREERVELLVQFCREGYAMAKRHGHFLVGVSGTESYIAIPGRFLLEEQPAGGQTGFTLWQPLRGGEAYFGRLEEIGEDTAEAVYGYWIARLNPDTLEVSEV